MGKGKRERALEPGRSGGREIEQSLERVPPLEKEVLRKRPYLKKEWCTRVLEAPIRSEPQDKIRYRFWAEIPELADRYLRVITLEDKVTIHNAFPDRRFKP